MQVGEPSYSISRLTSRGSVEVRSLTCLKIKERFITLSVPWCQFSFRIRQKLPKILIFEFHCSKQEFAFPWVVGQ